MKVSNCTVAAVKGKQCGGALVETIALCVVMSPLVLLIPMLGNITDLKHMTVQASRYLAWEQTVSQDAASSRLVRARFFDYPEVPLQSSLRTAEQQSKHNGLWHVASAGESGRNTTPAEITVAFPPGDGYVVEQDVGRAGTARAIGEGVQLMGSTLGFLDNVEWNIEGDGTVDAGIELNILSNAFLESAGTSCNGSRASHIFGCLSAHNTIMVDGWGVAENAVAENRTRALVPGVVFHKAGNALSNLGKIPLFKEFSGLDHALGHIDSTQLPLDRYIGSYVSAK